jgi:hypothetical protein
MFSSCKYPAVPFKNNRQLSDEEFPVLSYKVPVLLGFWSTVDRDQTVSRRSKPNSRITFVGEQPNPWKLFHLQDVMSRHRGAKLPRRSVL